MKVNQIVSEMSSGCVASVAMPIGNIKKRTTETTNVPGLKPAGTVSSKNKKKGQYANSVLESKTSDRPVQEAKLDEDDLILVPGQGMTRRTGFVRHDPDKAEHEGQTLKNSLHTIIRVATHLNKELSTQDNFPEWVSEKIGAIKHMMVTVMDYVISDKEMHGRVTSNETGGVIAAGGVGEGKFTVNRNTGARLHPRTGAELPPKEKPLTMKQMFTQPKSTAPKLTLDAVWRKVEDVVGQIFPDGDPIDYLAPWLEKHGIRDFKIGEILDRAAKKNGYKDLYDYYDSMKDQYARDNVAEGSGPQVGDEVYYGNRLVGWFKGYSKFGKIITEPNVDEMGDEYLSKDAYWDPQPKITIKPKQGVAEGSEQTEETAVINMFEKLVKQGRDPIDMIAHKFGWGSYELDQLARNLGFKNSAGWTNAVKQGKGVNEGVTEGGILKSIKRGLQGWDKNAVGPAGEKLGDPREIVKRAKAMDTDTAKKVRAGLDAASDHSPAGLQKRVLDRKLKDVAEGAKVDRMVQHIKKSEIKTGKSKDEAEDIAWATVNKRGYLDNKNKKAK